MEFFIAAAIVAVAVGLFYGIRHKKSQPSRPEPEAFVCRACGERHCQCDRQA